MHSFFVFFFFLSCLYFHLVIQSVWQAIDYAIFFSFLQQWVPFRNSNHIPPGGHQWRSLTFSYHIVIGIVFSASYSHLCKSHPSSLLATGWLLHVAGGDAPLLLPTSTTLGFPVRSGTPGSDLVVPPGYHQGTV